MFDSERKFEKSVFHCVCLFQVLEISREGLVCCSMLQHPHRLPTIIQPPEPALSRLTGSIDDVSQIAARDKDFSSDLSPPVRTSGDTPEEGRGKQVRGADREGEGVIDEGVMGEGVTGKCLTGEEVMGEGLTGERVIGGVVTGEEVKGEVVLSGGVMGEGVVGEGVVNEGVMGEGVTCAVVDLRRQSVDDDSGSSEEDSDSELLQMFVDAPANASDAEGDCQVIF